MSIVKTAAVTIVCILLSAVGFSVRIKLSVDTPTQLIHTSIQESRVEVCSDYSEVHKYHLSLPVGFEKLPKPWAREEAKVVHSKMVTEGMNKLFSLTVPGLNGDTIRDVLEAFTGRGCLCFPYGGSVRDQFLERAPKDLDMEVSCSREEALRICQQKWGEGENCQSPNSIVHIGSQTVLGGSTDNIDSRNWGEMFFASHIYLEYTTNSLAYNPNGDDVVIDITGDGVVDTCNRHIRIPVKREKWDDWKDNRYRTKLYRFWKLRVKGYSAIDEETYTYIIVGTKQAILEDPKSFKTFYCAAALQGKASVKGSGVTCLIKNCGDTLKSVVQYEYKFREDLGEEFWSSVATPIKNEINTICSET